MIPRRWEVALEREPQFGGSLGAGALLALALWQQFYDTSQRRGRRRQQPSGVASQESTFYYRGGAGSSGLAGGCRILSQLGELGTRLIARP